MQRSNANVILMVFCVHDPRCSADGTNAPCPVADNHGEALCAVRFCLLMLGTILAADFMHSCLVARSSRIRYSTDAPGLSCCS